jgi:hypothetical protein
VSVTLTGSARHEKRARGARMGNMPRRLLGPDEHRLIARMHVDGAPDSAIARAVAEQFGKPVDRSTIRKARARPGVQEMIVEEHRRKVDRDRAARYRVRKAEREQVAADIERGAGPPPPRPRSSVARRTGRTTPTSRRAARTTDRTSEAGVPPPAPTTSATAGSRPTASRICRALGNRASSAIRSAMSPKIRRSSGSVSHRASARTSTARARRSGSSPFGNLRLPI